MMTTTNPSAVPGETQMILVDQNVLVDDGPSYRFTTDWSCETPSAAECVVLGGSADGLLAWQDDHWRSLEEPRKGEGR